MTHYRGTPSYLRVVFSAPGFFLMDSEVSLFVNGHPVLRHSFRAGFDWWAEMRPGFHYVEARIGGSLGIARTKMYTIEVRHGLTTIATLDYSRLWGNFTDAPSNVRFVQA